MALRATIITAWRGRSSSARSQRRSRSAFGFAGPPPLRDRDPDPGRRDGQGASLALVAKLNGVPAVVTMQGWGFSMTTPSTSRVGS
jgi:hypothetical protein